MNATIQHLNQKEKPKREGFKWGQELLKWKTAHAELQKKYEDLIQKTLEENEDFLGGIRKDAYKDGQRNGIMESYTEYEKKLKGLANAQGRRNEVYREKVMEYEKKLKDLETLQQKKTEGTCNSPTKINRRNLQLSNEDKRKIEETIVSKD